MFAKLYESNRFGQILVKIDTDSDEGRPEVRFYFKPKGLGVCSAALIFADSDQGWELAEEAFQQLSLEKGESMIESLAGDIPSLFEPEGA
jgi:hypothetical protein